ncbi:hypothetical protein [Streptomyces celluloflavus]|uniref:hypothetical protein n=1 Tax=Streptomyces celluloflavus TaxID=58344 RepID=UPI0036C926D6
MRCTACSACTAPLDTAAQLCTACTRGLDTRLAELPSQYLLLADHLRPGAARSDGPVDLVREAPLPVREDVLTLRTEGGIVSVLEEWPAAMQDARGWGSPVRAGSIERRVLTAARGLRLNLGWIATEFTGAGALAQEIRHLTAEVRSILAPPAKRAAASAAAPLSSTTARYAAPRSASRLTPSGSSAEPVAPNTRRRVG